MLEGWDGSYLGKASPSGTYLFQIKAKSYSGEVIEKTGRLNLLR